LLQSLLWSLQWRRLVNTAAAATTAAAISALIPPHTTGIAVVVANVTACSQRTNWTELNFVINSRIGIHALKTVRAQNRLCLLQPVSTKYSHDADARDQ